MHHVATTGRLRVAERRAVELIHAAGTGAVLTLLARPAEERDRRLADTLYEAVMHSVLTDTPPQTTNSAAGAAVVLRADLLRLSMLTPGE